MMTLKGHSNTVACCCVTPDGKHIISASGEKKLKVWKIILI
ncbi:MAG: hypothetical protein HRT87_10095 [Legionellales bacterium]|nr:hypothetical protein [Legionellales bacterium]